MSDEFVKNLKQPSAWLRVLFMAGFVLALYVAGVILMVITLAQILFSLITGTDNANLRHLGSSLTNYVSQILEFLTYNSHDKPFPFAAFPVSAHDKATDAKASADATAADINAEAAGPRQTRQRDADPVPDDTAADSAARVMAESAARRATKATSKTPRAGASPAAGADPEAGAKKPTDKSPEMDVTDVIERQVTDV